MDTLKKLTSSTNALAVLGLAALSGALVLLSAGGPLSLTILLLVVSAVFDAVWWLQIRK